MPMSPAVRTAFDHYGLLDAELSEASRVLAALVTGRPTDPRSSKEFNAAVEQALAAVKAASAACQVAFDEYVALAEPQPALEVPASDARLVQHVVSSLSDSTIELEQSSALSLEHGNNFIGFGYLQLQNPFGFARDFDLLTRRSDARGLYLREWVNGSQLVELLPEHLFSLFEYMSLRPLGWREGKKRAAHEYVRRKLKSLAPAGSAQHA